MMLKYNINASVLVGLIMSPLGIAMSNFADKKYLHVSVLMGLSSGSVYNKYDWVN
jgi:hypothetical protein